jgi:glucokinase
MNFTDLNTEKIVLSIDIGGTHTKLALVNREGQFLAVNQLLTGDYSDEDSYFRGLFKCIATTFSKMHQDYYLEGIGVGAPACNYEKGIIEHAANLPFNKQVNIIDILKKQYGVPIYLIKDGNAAALGEGAFGAATDMKNFVLITLGTGLGCGIVINGEVVHGNTGVAGEVGHTIVKRNGRQCNCGRRGCLETYVSAGGVKRTAYNLLAQEVLDSPLRDIPFNELTAYQIFDLASKGDELSLKSFEYTGKKLGKSLADLANAIEPEAIFFAGGLAEAGDFLFKPTQHYLEKNLFTSLKGKIKILPSALKVNEAALLGAASLVWRNQKYSP